MKPMNLMNPIYLDYNATTPIAPEVAETLHSFLTDFWGNPSSGHAYGREAKRAIDTARQQVADLLNCDPSEIIFTSGGTESNNMALKGAAFALRDRGNHLITSQIEHPAISEVCQFLEKNGFSITYLPVDKYGAVSPVDVQNAIRPETILISIMHANNEVGTIQPISEIGNIARDNGILLHTDAAQSTGKIRTDVQALNVDMLSIAGHKLYAPKGIGVLYLRNGVQIEKWMHGANHEGNRRAGTENAMFIAALGKACEIAMTHLDENQHFAKSLRDELHLQLSAEIPGLQLNGHPEKRLPNTLNLSFPKCAADQLLANLPEVAASAGAACHSGETHISATLRAMQIPVEIAAGAVRFSTGKFLIEKDIRQAATAIIRAYRRCSA
ncbi:MAG: cysteine desulfurase family protein [Calditrichia bacterium]